MESPSQTPHSGSSLWKGILITASIISSWIQPTSVQSDSISIVPKPPYGTVGSSVILDILGSSEQPPSYTWYRRTNDPYDQIVFYSVATGEQTPPQSRLKVFSNGSLLIPDLTLSDTDDYLVLFLNSSSALIATARVHLAVYGPLSKPTISSTNMAPVENKDTVSLTCQSESQDVTYLVWFINQGSPADDRILLSLDNRTVTITKATRENQGPYQCEIRNPVDVTRSDPFTLNFAYGPDTPMIVPTDTHYPVGATLELSCSADSNPPAQYTWLFSGMEMVSTSQLSIPNVNLNDTGTYTCNASNSITGLSSSKDISVTILEYNGSSLSGGAMAGTVIGVLVGMALIGTLIYFLFYRKTGRASKDHLSEKNPSALKHGEDTILYENIVHLKDSALSAQGLGSSPAFPEVPSESAYQALDMTRVDIYAKIDPWKNPQIQEREEGS
ncbi:carcinoembryonic antigen-related cell adhesion molecule 1-like [Trichosurus vulpecula]|uniref:carcinoembryonic antigen-related cell adhesion molecule 1-like n=1 Tax=Trichosurus vulpecula TaxID=9337 RepID=UPI00186B077F|nr:carcinoembryonic antigen-related cell adhesion molecule 1-like [Trichosurus vulpecula]